MADSMALSSSAEKTQKQDGVRALELLENQVEKQIREFLEWDGWIVRKMEQNYSPRKRKSVGETGMADLLAIRYGPHPRAQQLGETWCQEDAEVLWIETKRLVASPARKRSGFKMRQSWPKSTRAANHQKAWHARERLRGALTLIAGEDFEASIEGFHRWYRNSGLCRRTL